MGGIVLLPVLGYLIKTRFANGRWVGFALLAFVAALTFRVADGWGWLHMGTHFLWHSFGAIAAFCMFQYLYLINIEKYDR
jgi:hemolysin III